MFQRHENNKHSKTQPSNQAVAQRTAHVTTLAHAHPSFVAQQMIGNQAIASLYESKEQQEGEKAQEQQSAGRVSPLPEGLRKRLELLAGINLENIHVHYDSDKPAQLNAEAYAQGNDIYLAPGSEHHLPHEAWHIVQQAQGRVQPTVNIGDTAVNTNQALEQEATKMGDLALHEDTSDASMLDAAGQVQADKQGLPIAQLASYSENHSKNNAHSNLRKLHKDEMEQLLDLILTKVETARERALQWQDFEFENESGHLKKWYRSAKGYVDDPKEAHSFLSADFGYAIESIACKELGNAFGNFDIKFQVSEGHTRPDIVVLHNNNELGWLDITSIKSKGHIFKKTGSGWKSKPFVYEIFYDELNAQDLFENSSNSYYKEYGEFVQEENKIVAQETLKITDKWRYGLSKFRSKANLDKVKGGVKKREQLTKAYLLRKTGNTLNTKNNRQALKGAITYLGGSHTVYGYKTGKQETQTIKEAVRIRAKENIKERKEELNTDTNESTSAALQGYQQHPLVQQFDGLYQSDDTNRTTVQKGLALKSALVEQEKLLRWKQSIIEEDTIVEYIDKVLVAFPIALEVDQLTSWITSATRLISGLKEMFIDID